MLQLNAKKALSIYERAKNAGIEHVTLKVYPKRDFFLMLNVILDTTVLLSDELEKFFTHILYPEKEGITLEEVKSEYDDVIRSKIGCSLEEFINNFETKFHDSAESYRETDIDTAGGFVKELNEIKNGFIITCRVLYNIQDKYKKLKANHSAFDKYEDFFVNKIDGMRALLKQLGDIVVVVLKDIEDSMLNAIKHKNDRGDIH